MKPPADASLEVRRGNYAIEAALIDHSIGLLPPTAATAFHWSTAWLEQSGNNTGATMPTHHFALTGAGLDDRRVPIAEARAQLSSVIKRAADGDIILISQDRLAVPENQDAPAVPFDFALTELGIADEVAEAASHLASARIPGKRGPKRYQQPPGSTIDSRCTPHGKGCTR